LAQNMQVGPCIPVGRQLETAEVAPTSGPTWHLSHWCGDDSSDIFPASRGTAVWFTRQHRLHWLTSRLIACDAHGVNLAQKVRVCPCIPVRTQHHCYKRLKVGPTSGPTWHCQLLTCAASMMGCPGCETDLSRLTSCGTHLGLCPIATLKKKESDHKGHM
jgi:hypothetical protein